MDYDGWDQGFSSPLLPREMDELLDLLGLVEFFSLGIGLDMGIWNGDLLGFFLVSHFLLFFQSLLLILSSMWQIFLEIECSHQG